MSDILSIGASGVRAYQTALGVVGENIANAGTAGYVRRDVVLKEAAAGKPGFLTEIDRTILGGVSATGVSRAWDQFRAAEVRRGSADAAGTETAIPFLQRIETSLDKGGITTALTGFFNSATALAADPTGAGPRAAMLEAAAGAASAFRSTAEGLGQVAGDVSLAATTTAGEFSRLAKGLAELNAGIVRARPGSNGQAQLLDQRDALLDQMAQIAKIDVTIADTGAATVAMGGPGGPTLVDSKGAGSVTIDIAADGRMSFFLHRDGQRETVAIGSGALAGLAEASVRTAQARSEVDRVATAFADGVNAVQAAGIDQDGAVGTDLFDATGGAAGLAMLATSGRAIAAAGPFTVASGATNRGSGVLSAAVDPNAGTPAAPPVRLAVDGSDLVARDPVTDVEIARTTLVAGAPTTIAGMTVTLAGSPQDGDSFTVRATGAASRDNSNLAGLATLRTADGPERSFAALVTGNASQLAAKRTIAEAQVAIRDGAVSARDAISGVNLDTEAVELLRFQQAYSASSRVIQVAREMFDSILQATR
ncbi:flagellar hook-associated protein 1 FlgK [Sphingomonas jejuensis]|uniref:Flagellar hook-associated protein 1 n=1 Tax=Sphingomonas jejuensis TaxID=904715 RepID=A0ABX0XNG5_9SPHN|nr:flagellar basal body rod C-terminal domain-containing protein [Sphingomonas jejuensis]NJC34770.1 flagellar hook-associated protein 1 FlgK [Sphingomonas jejuensis]